MPKKKQVKEQQTRQEAKTRKTVDDLKATLSGKGVNIFTGAELETCQHVRRPFGVPSLDLAIAGGAAGGAPTIIYGPENAGKTLLTFWNMAECQVNYGANSRILVLTLGGPPDKPFARVQGVRIPFSAGEKARYIELYAKLHGAPPSAEDIKEAGKAVGRVDFLLPNAEDTKSLERSLEAFVQLVATREYQLAIVDDVGSTAPGDVADHSIVEEPKRAYYARIMTLFMQKLLKSLGFSGNDKLYNNTSVIMTCQVRQGTSEWEPFVMTFGKCIRHNAATIIRVEKKTQKVDDKIGQFIEWKITKGRNGHGDGASGAIPFRPHVRYDKVLDLAETAVVCEIIARNGTWFNYGDIKVQNYADLAKAIESKGLYLELMDKVFASRGIVWSTE